jgi:hypothetical protein
MVGPLSLEGHHGHTGGALASMGQAHQPLAQPATREGETLGCPIMREETWQPSPSLAPTLQLGGGV